MRLRIRLIIILSKSSVFTFPIHKEVCEIFESSIEIAIWSKSTHKVKVGHRYVFRIPCHINILASVSLVLTHWKQVIRKMTFHEARTGSRAEGDCRLVPRSWKQLTFLELRISFLDILSAYFAIVVDLPDNFLNPSCPYKSPENLVMTSPYELTSVRPYRLLGRERGVSISIKLRGSDTK